MTHNTPVCNENSGDVWLSHFLRQTSCDIIHYAGGTAMRIILILTCSLFLGLSSLGLSSLGLSSLGLSSLGLSSWDSASAAPSKKLRSSKVPSTDPCCAGRKKKRR